MPDRIVLVDRYTWTVGGRRYHADQGQVVTVPDEEAARGGDLGALGAPPDGAVPVEPGWRDIETLPPHHTSAALTLPTGSVPGAGRADVAVTWAEPMHDANYAVTAAVQQDVDGDGLRVRRVRSVTAAGAIVTVENTGLTAAQGTLHVHAMR